MMLRRTTGTLIVLGLIGSGPLVAQQRTARRRAAAHPRPLPRRHPSRHRRRQPAARGARRRRNPRTRRQRRRRRHCRQRRHGPHGAHRQRHRRRPVRHLLRREDGPDPRLERQRLGPDRPHAGTARLQGPDRDAGARHLHRHRPRRRRRLARDAREVREAEFSQLLAPAIYYAEEGFPLSEVTARPLGGIAEAR